MSNIFARFVKDESGATAIEYGLIAARFVRLDWKGRPTGRPFRFPALAAVKEKSAVLLSPAVKPVAL